MSVALRKIWGDLRDNRGQVLMLFAAILIGQAAMTAAFMARAVISVEIDRSFSMAKAPDITVEAANVSEGSLAELERLPGIEAVDGLTVLSARYRVGDGSWRPIVLFGRRDFGDLRVSRLFRTSGTWPPAPEQVLVERSGLGILDRAMGENLNISFGRGRSFSLQFSGVVHDPAQAPSWQENAIYGYTHLSTLERVAAPRTIQFHILLAPGAEAGAVAQRAAQTLMARGARIVRVTPVPAAHPHADLMQGLLILLSVFSLLSYALALFLAGSIVASLAQRQERQLAVLRALGASRARIAIMHLAFALTPSLLALLAGAILGEGAARLLQDAIADQLNIEILESSPSAGLRMGLMIAGAIGILVALIVPIASSLRRTVQEVLQSGLKRTRKPWIRLGFLQPIDRLAVAEAFQRPLRTSITVAALTVAGVALLSSTNMYVSLVGVVDRLLEARRDTISVIMSDRADPAALGARLRAIDGLQAYELWDRKGIMLSTPGATAERMVVYAPPSDTQMGLPVLLEGRRPTNAGEIAVSKLAVGHNARLNLAIGQQVTMTTTEGATTTARIVGLVDEFGMSVWTSPATFDRLATPNDRGRELRAIVDPALAAPALATAEQAIIASGNFPIASSTREGRRDGMVNHFFSFYQFLLVASLTAGIVGGAALSANIGANVLGRTREIGVLRALGTGSRTLFRLVLVQAFAVTLFSLLLAIVIGLPLSAFIVDQMEERALHMYMPLVISWPALAGLTAGALVLAALAAVAPAIRVRRLAIREAISVE